MLETLFRRNSRPPETVDLRLSCGGWSVQGRSRDVNQDQWAADPLSGMFVVADGIGGGVCGDLASRIAVECIRQQLSRSNGDHADVEDLIHAAFATAQERILLTAASRGCQCMGTTAACAVVRENAVSVGWVGDSRVYLVRGDETYSLTHDQTIAQGLADAGIIECNCIERHRMRNVLWNYLGLGDDITGKPEVCTAPVQPGDRLLLLTDGVSDMLDEAQLQAIATSCLTPKVAASRIVQAALLEGTHDDVTCLTVFIETADE